MSNIYWLNEDQMARLRPFFLKSHGKSRVDDRRVLSRVIFINRNGLRWCDAPKEYGPAKTLYNRWKRWGGVGVFVRMMEGLAACSNALRQMPQGLPLCPRSNRLVLALKFNESGAYVFDPTV